MSTLKPIKNIVQEISHQVVLTDLARETMEWLINQAITQDRASIHTSLVAAVEGLSRKEVSDDYDGGYNHACDDTHTIINSIFKE